MKKNNKNKYKYCGRGTSGKTMCGNCSQKLNLVRQLLQMVKDTFERYGEGGKNYG